MCNYKRGFLIVDIAFSLLIMSFAFILILQAQGIITKQLNTHDIHNFQVANDNLFNNIQQHKCQQYTLTTKQNHKYKMCLIEGIGHDINLRYYMPY